MPSMYLLKENKVIKFEGDFKYHDMFNFINIYSETFVFPGDEEKKQEIPKAKKPWLNVAVPFMTADSANDICLKKDGTLCVIYISNDSTSNNDVVEVFNEVKSQF